MRTSCRSPTHPSTLSSATWGSCTSRVPSVPWLSARACFVPAASWPSRHGLIPPRHRLVGVFLDAVAEARAMPSRDLPRGPDFFRFSDDEAFAAALREQGLAGLDVADITFVQRFASADELWDGMLAATVRVSALLTHQPGE